MSAPDAPGPGQPRCGRRLGQLADDEAQPARVSGAVEEDGNRRLAPAERVVFEPWRGQSLYGHVKLRQAR